MSDHDTEHWYLLSEDRFAEFLSRAAAGEAPDMLMAEAWAVGHSCTEDHHDDCEDQDVYCGIATFSLAP